jgi:NitT/TauT family transport system substrate-binding protein
MDMKNTRRRFGYFTAAMLTILSMVCIFDENAAAEEKESPTHLRLALLPIPDVLPVYVAEAKGYFIEAGITVEALAVGSAVERDQLMQAGRIDGMINEISGAALFNRESAQMQIVSYARIPLGTAPLFRVLAAPGSSISSVADLAGVPVAISKNTVIEYITERLLQSGGVQSADIKFRSVPVLPERLQLLLAGQIEAATLPDPLGLAAIQAGAVEVVNDLQTAHLSASVVSFSSASLSAKTDTVKKFMAAWDRAAADLNSNPQSFQALMLEKIRVPQNVRSTFQIPPFPRASVPTEQQWDDVQQWMLEKKLLSKKAPYSDSVTADFLAR